MFELLASNLRIGQQLPFKLMKLLTGSASSR